MAKETESQQLQVCIGEAGSALSVWLSLPIASICYPDFLAEWFSEGKLFVKYGCNSNKTISGVSSCLHESDLHSRFGCSITALGGSRERTDSAPINSLNC